MKNQNFIQFAQEAIGQQVEATVIINVPAKTKSGKDSKTFYSGFRYEKMSGILEASFGGVFSFFRINSYYGTNRDLIDIKLK